MPVPDKLACPVSDVPTHVRVLPIVNPCSSILFVVKSGVTWISLPIISSDDILIARSIGLLVSKGGSATRFNAGLPRWPDGLMIHAE